MTASAENYAQAVGVFLECVDRMWGGPMGGGLFEFSDDPRWRAERQDAAGGFHVLCKRLSELRKAARKTEEDHEN